MKQFFLFIAIIFCFVAHAQSEAQLIQEAKARNISTKQDALSALAAEGITENQARQLARMRGIDFDTFLTTYFGGNQAEVSGTAVANLPVVSELVVDPVNDSVVEEKINEEDTLMSPYFGYDIFKQNPFLEKEYTLGNIDEGYIISPGDVLRIMVFGNNSLELETKVDLNGNIAIPNYGVFQAAGNSFKTLKSRLTTYLGKYFSGLLTQPQNVFLDVSLTQIRPVKVTVLGQVESPGPQLVNGLASVLNALYAAGGVKTTGSLREIYVYRNNRKIRTIDLYDYITKGNLKRDIRLTSNDVLFVPNRKSTVALEGLATQTGFFELTEGETLRELIDYAGGLLPDVDTQAINIARIRPFEERQASFQYNRYLTTVVYSAEAGKNEFPLEDGDTVTLQPITALVEKALTVTGSVVRPGTYGLTRYSNLKSLLLEAAQGLLPNTYLGKVDIESEDKTGMRSFSTYNLDAVLSGNTQVTLKENDRINVYALEQVAGERLVKFSGFNFANTDKEEENVAKTIFWRENLSAFDVIFASVSFEELSFQQQLLTSRVDVKRYNKQAKQFENIRLSFDDLGGLKAFKLLPQDEVFIFSRSVTERTYPVIGVVGFVQKPDTLALEKNMLIEDAILKAGGFQESADMSLVVVNRERFDFDTGQLSERFSYFIDQDYLLGKKEAPASPFYLEDKDIISVRKRAGYLERKSIRINGAVKFPGTLLSQYEREDFKSFIERVGGLKRTANLKASYVIRAGKPLAIDLSKVLNKVFLEDGDQVYIAENSGTVQTLGGLENESLFVWEQGKRAKYYLRHSGGKIAKEGGKTYLVQPNGQSQRVGFLKNPIALPGAKLIVNRKPVKARKEGKFLDDFSRIFGVISGTLTTILLTQRL